jgi:murein DD-endopeptidase MepM/ murein hydrolase activator NlpD
MPYTNPLPIMQIRSDGPSPINNTFGRYRDGGTRWHGGWDLSAPLGTPTYAIAGAKVVYVGKIGGYGTTVVLEFQHQGQTFYAWYAHLLIPLVRKGSIVSAGQAVGMTGKSGNAANTPPHLHFEIRRAKAPGQGLGTLPIDPQEILGPAPLVCRPGDGGRGSSAPAQQDPAPPAAAPGPSPTPSPSPEPAPTSTPGPSMYT